MSHKMCKSTSRGGQIVEMSTDFDNIVLSTEHTVEMRITNCPLKNC